MFRLEQLADRVIASPPLISPEISGESAELGEISVRKIWELSGHQCGSVWRLGGAQWEFLGDFGATPGFCRKICGLGWVAPTDPVIEATKSLRDVNSKNSNYCPKICVREFLSSRRQTPEMSNFCVFTVSEFLPHLPRNSRASRGRKFRFVVSFFFVFCGRKLLWAGLKAPGLTGYVGDA